MLMYGYANNAEGNFNADNYVIENMIENDILKWYINYEKTYANKTNKRLLKIDKIVYKLDKLLTDYFFFLYLFKAKGFLPFDYQYKIN